MSFDPPKNPIFNAVREAPPVQRTYILFLVREADGRYAPVVGQADPGLAIKELWEGTSESGAGEFEIRDSRSPPDKDYTQWAENCLKDFESVKAAMTRGQVEGKLSKDGGLQGVSPVRFTHPACPYFKIDVEFEFKRDAADQNRAIMGEADRVTKVSKPYIERPFFD